MLELSDREHALVVQFDQLLSWLWGHDTSQNVVIPSSCAAIKNVHLQVAAFLNHKPDKPAYPALSTRAID